MSTNLNNSKALVVVAHPDDAEFGCSASVAKWCKREGLSVSYVICTDGSKGTEDMSLTSADLSAMRRKEQRNAANILGLDEVVFLDYPDGYLEPTLELRRDIVRQIRRKRPEIVITTNSQRNLTNRALTTYIGHPDHFAAGEATMSAVFPSARDHLAFPELLKDEGLEAWKVSELWVMNIGGDLNMYHPVSAEDVEISLQALFAHESQIGDKEHAKSFMMERRRDFGSRIHSEYAEGFLRFNL